MSSTNNRFLLPAILFSTVAAGQLIRFQPFTSSKGAIILADLSTLSFAIFLVGWLSLNRQWAAYRATTWANPVWKWLLIFVGWALLALLLNLPHYGLSSSAIGFSHWLRLALWAVLGTGVSFLCRDWEVEQFTDQFLLWSGILLILGYLQWRFVSDFSFMALLGWDPHQGRMLSTFFDPNFFGAFLILPMSLVLSRLLWSKSSKAWLWWIYLLLLWFGLYLTVSRSAWAAGAIALSIVALRRSWKYALIILIIFAGVLKLPNRLGSRFEQASSAVNQTALQADLQTTTIQNLGSDSSGSARVISWRKGWELSKKHLLFGVGYNNYSSALQKDGLGQVGPSGAFVGNGSDSSLLTILATTGIIGLLLYLTFLWQLLLHLIDFWKKEGVGSQLAIALLGFTVAWIVGATFNNSLLYTLLVIPWVTLCAISFGRHQDG